MRGFVPSRSMSRPTPIGSSGHRIPANRVHQRGGDDGIRGTYPAPGGLRLVHRAGRGRERGERARRRSPAHERPGLHLHVGRAGAATARPRANAPRSASGFRPDAEAVAIRGERIVFVGADARGPGLPRPEDAGGGSRRGHRPARVSSTRTPTWSSLGEAASQVDLVDVATEEEAVARVAARAAAAFPRASGSWGAAGTRGPGPTTTRA